MLAITRNGCPTKPLRTKTSRKGYKLIDTDCQSELSLCQRLEIESAGYGTPCRGRFGNFTERIVPMTADTAYSSSLSAMSGLRRMPFHSDFAHRLTPARWLMIGCLAPGKPDVPTLLLDWGGVRLSHEERSILKSAPFLVRTGRRSFYSTVLSDERSFVRHDPGCMQPVGTRSLNALAILHDAFSRAQLIRIDWKPGRLLLVNNWNMLHARDDATKSTGRVLLRRAVG